MSGLKKLVLVLIALFMISPIFLCLYTTLLFGNSLVGIQWLSAFILCGAGLLLITVVEDLMKWAK